MELNQNFTKPTVRSVLSFTEKELINALQEYAERNGYSFAKNSKYVIWHPRQRGIDEYLTKLVVDVVGNNGAILEEAKVINKHKDCHNKKNGLANMPIEYIGRFYNGCSDPCDMLSGPCACGTSHKQEEWSDWLQLEVFGFVSDKDSFIKRKEQKSD